MEFFRDRKEIRGANQDSPSCINSYVIQKDNEVIQYFSHASSMGSGVDVNDVFVYQPMGLLMDLTYYFFTDYRQVVIDALHLSLPCDFFEFRCFVTYSINAFMCQIKGLRGCKEVENLILI